MRWFAYVCAMIVLASCQPAWASFDFEPFSAGSKFDTAGGRCTDSKPVIAISPTSLVFANTSTGQTRVARVSVTNNGNATWTGIGYSNFASNVFAHVTAGQSPCGTTLAAGATCNHDVSCTPVDTSTATDGFSFTSDQFAAKAVTVSCTGIAAAPIISLEFEPGEDHTGWTSAGSTLPITNSTANILRGTQSLRLTDTGTDATFRSPTFAAQSTFHTSFMFSITNVATSSTANFFQLFNGSTSLARISLINSNLNIGIGTKTSTTYALTAATTYYIWLDYIAGTGANGVAAYYISTTGIKPVAATYTITNGESTLPVDNVMFTGRHSTNPNSYDFDHVLGQSTVIGDRN